MATWNDGNNLADTYNERTIFVVNVRISKVLVSPALWKVFAKRIDKVDNDKVMDDPVKSYMCNTSFISVIYDKVALIYAP